MSEVEEVKVGPWTFSFWPDGDDPGVGEVRVASWYMVATYQATRDEWREFVRACGR